MSPALSAGGWRVAPLVVVKEARVAVEVELAHVPWTMMTVSLFSIARSF
jgi:hypothetical protein